jgi:hypothetical protein
MIVRMPPKKSVSVSVSVSANKRSRSLLQKKKAYFLKKKKLITRSYIEKLFACTPKDCPLYLIQKDGHFVETPKSYLIDYKDIIFLINNLFSHAHIRFPLLVGRHEKDVLDKLLTLRQCQEENIVFYIENYDTKKGHADYRTFEDIYVKGKMIKMVFLRHSHIESFVKIYFFHKCARGEIPNLKIKPRNIIEKLAWIFYLQSLIHYEPQPDSLTSVRLFYTSYITSKELQEELLKKYNIDIRVDVDSYAKLYHLLQRLGYVKLFYTKIFPKCKTYYHKIESTILRNKYYVEELRYFHSYRPFQDKILMDTRDIDLEKVVKAHVSDTFDKEWIVDQLRKANTDKKIHFHIL